MVEDGSDEEIKSGPILLNEVEEMAPKQRLLSSVSKMKLQNFYNPVNTLTPSPASDEVFENNAKLKAQKRPKLNECDDYKAELIPLVRPSQDISSLLSSNSKPAKSVESLLYPDDEYPMRTVKKVEHVEILSDDSSQSAPNLTDYRYECASVKLGSKIVEESRDMKICIVIRGTVMLLEVRNYVRQDLNVQIDKTIVKKARLYDDKNENVQYIEILFNEVPVDCSLLQARLEDKEMRLKLKTIQPVIGMRLAQVFGYAFVDSGTCTPSTPTSTPSLRTYEVQQPYRRSIRIMSLKDSSSSPLIPSLGQGRSALSKSQSWIRSMEKAEPLINSPVIPEKIEPLFIYPESGKGAVTITTADTPRLEHGIFLNDTLIDFDLVHLYYEQFDDLLRARSHLFSSFFYKRLHDEGHDGVKKWTEGTDIFSKDFLIIPICEHLHWYLAIICYPRHVLSSSGHSANDPIELEEESEDGCCYILIFDSLMRTRPHTLARLKNYLVAEAMDKLGAEARKEQSHGVMVKCPQQDNYTDCGLFTCQFVEQFFSADPDENFERAKQGQLAQWFPLSLAKERRQRLKELIATIASTTTYQHPVDMGNSSDIEEIICLE